jgi:hypothetical protein
VCFRGQLDWDTGAQQPPLGNIERKVAKLIQLATGHGEDRRILAEPSGLAGAGARIVTLEEDRRYEHGTAGDPGAGRGIDARGPDVGRRDARPALCRRCRRDGLLDGTCTKPAIIDELKRGVAQRDGAVASGAQIVTSYDKEDLNVTVHGDLVITRVRSV